MSFKDRSEFLLWKCEHCGKPVPYPFYFCSECAEKLLGEPPKPLEPIKMDLLKGSESEDME